MPCARSEELGRPMAQVALAWTLAQPGITAPIVGVSRVEQLQDNLASLDIRFTPEQLRTLNQVSAPEPTFPYNIFTPEINQSIFGGFGVQGWQ